MSSIPEYLVNNLSAIRSRMESVAAQSGRDFSEIRLLPVTKTHSSEMCNWLLSLGLNYFGENRVQEAAEKRTGVVGSVHWELIGHLQSNKVKQALDLFDRIQTVDSLKLVRRIASLVEPENTPYPILLQINAGNDPAKFGMDPELAEELLCTALSHPQLRVEGLMTIAPLDENLSVARRCFARLRKIRDELERKCGHPLSELSMGMSGDWEEAVKEGATVIRVGSALLGQRG